MTVGQLLNNMSATEFAMWMAYAKVENERIDKEYGKSKEPTPEEQEVQHQVFESNVLAQMERKGIRARKKKVAASET